MVDVARDALGRIRPVAPVAVLVPRIPVAAPLAELTDDRLDREIPDTLDAVLSDVQAVLGDVARIVFVLPHAPLMAVAGGAAASAVANGVLSMARTLAIELARDRVTVNMVALDPAAPSAVALADQLTVLTGDGGDAVTGQEIYLTAGTDLGRLRP